MTKKREPPRNALKPQYDHRARCIRSTLSLMLPATNALDKLKAHPVFRHLTSDSVVAFTRFASHLQLMPQSNPSILPAVLPLPITNLLGASLGMSTNVIDDGHVD